MYGFYLFGCGGSVLVAHGLSCPAARRILVPQAGIESAHPALATWGVLTTGPPVKSLNYFLN